MKKKCLVQECGRKVLAKGLCSAHYQRLWSFGTPKPERKIGERKGIINITHGLCYSPEYAVWKAMQRRCQSPNDRHFNDYGGRGIKVCERWSKFANFISDMGRRPTPLHEIERKNNNKGYSPENCKWATRKEQLRNTRFNYNIQFNGEVLCLSAWAEKLGVKRGLLQNRLDRGWLIENAFTKPVTKNRKTL